MPSNFDEKMPLYYEGNTLGILRRSFFPQDLRAFYTTVYLYVYKKRNFLSRKENVKEEKMLGKNVKEKCCKVVNLNSFKDQFRNKNFNGMSGPNGRFRLEFCNFV